MDGLRKLAALCLLLFALLAPSADAQPRLDSSKMAVELVADGQPEPGSEWLLALHFTPSSPEWHGYWSNPGDAGLGMTLDWRLPPGWKVGEPLYPVPETLLIGGLMNHIYEGDYAVLVPVTVPRNANVADREPVELSIDYLACTDRVCVPQSARLVLDPATSRTDGRFGAWRAAIAPQLDSNPRFEFSGNRLRIGIPLPASIGLGEPHVFVASPDLGEGRQVDYAAIQTFIRNGDLLVAEVPIKDGAMSPGAGQTATGELREFGGILSFGEGQGVRFTALPGDVPLEGGEPLASGAQTPALLVLLLAALAGGLLLNVMPCVFPILSLKALALAKAGGDAISARRDALAYTAGVVIACAALGAGLLLLRSAGEQVGWAFQLQEPAVVVALFLLAVAITANFLGLFEVPGMSISGGPPTSRGSFATGLLAAFVATPCTGPFMAAALGAALLLPPLEAMLLFVALGIGLALPFLLIGFVPALRGLLPRPGGWMVTFRRWMALPMGLTAAALFWLLWRFGGTVPLVAAALVALVIVGLLATLGKRQRQGAPGQTIFAGAVVALAIIASLTVPRAGPGEAMEADESLLAPQPFSGAALAAARASGKPVFVWFTADWCVTCKVNERVAIERETTKTAFDKAGVISLRGDYTRRNPEIAEFLARQGAAGVPLYLWYEPGGDAEQLPQVLTPEGLAQLAARPRPRP
ncbi:thiol:disulfide interchange protein [Altererythrobacter oceanensis]|uniref:Thiol:disulfide interchange protein n=2 Tax=Qipengyuania oceanensis TaxID=1463597 RepID=A0A844YB80_9SPHN|nr:thioredoxin family protein [Qipengyuania oceanensis]MXO62216.1 thiol:disulfide interchange protein [Qipengyuania oceanensis]